MNIFKGISSAVIDSGTSMIAGPAS